MMQISIITEKQTIGCRLDQLIAEQAPECSRKIAANAILAGNILVNGSPRKPGYRLKEKDLIEGEIRTAQIEKIPSPQAIPLKIIHEDPWLIVIDKAVGMVVHPGAGNVSGTLVNALLYHHPTVASVGNPERPGIVHRLDKDTSGLLVVAKTPHALGFLQKEFKCRRVEKRYLALVHGHITETQGIIDLPIGRHPVRRNMMAVQPDKGRSALTHWCLLAKYRNAGLIEAHIKTGRTHQIRVHFYAKGFPLLGDPVYQPRRFRRNRCAQQRQMLHSWKLSFRHPYSGRPMTFISEIPSDFKSALAGLPL